MSSELRTPDTQQRAVTFVAHEVTDAGGMERATRHLVEGLLRRGWYVRVIARSCDVAPSPRLRFVRVAGPRRPFPLSYPWFWIVGGVLVHRHRAGLVHGMGANVPQGMDVLTVHFLHRAARRHLAARYAGASVLRR